MSTPDFDPAQSSSAPVAGGDPNPEGTLEAAPEAIAPPPPPDRHECRACGYVYEPSRGDGRSQSTVGTPFEALPPTWRCPVCGGKITQFDNIGPAGKASGFEENLGYGLGVNSLTPGAKNLLIFLGLATAFAFMLSLYGLR